MSFAALLPILLLEISNSVRVETLFKPLAVLMAPSVSKLFSLIRNICNLVL